MQRICPDADNIRNELTGILQKNRRDYGEKIKIQGDIESKFYKNRKPGIKFREEKIMSSEKKAKEEPQEELMEGFGYCGSQQSKCLSDCVGGTPALSSLN